MSETLRRVQELVARGELIVSQHAQSEMEADQVSVRELIVGLPDAILVEDYPDHVRGPCFLALQRDSADEPLHVVWGLRRGTDTPAVAITAYRPDPAKWTGGFTRRRS